MTRIWLLSTILTIAALSGCSGSAATSSGEKAGVPATTVAAALPKVPGTSPVPGLKPPAESRLASSSTSSTTTTTPAATSNPDIGDLFAPPKIVVPAEPPPEPVLPSEPIVEESHPANVLPKLRLVGFVEVDGLQALLSVDNKLNIVTVGEDTEGIQIVAIDPPMLTLKHAHGQNELQLNLYDQPWTHQPAERRPVGGKGTSIPNVGGPLPVAPPTPATPAFGGAPATPPVVPNVR